MKFKKKKTTEYCMAFDPGDTQTAFVVVEIKTMKPVEFAKIDNNMLKSDIPRLKNKYNLTECAVEMIASYGMGVGKHVFDTCVWIGRFSEVLEQNSITVTYIYRKDEKMAICGSMKAKDSNIRIALIDIFAKHDKKNGKGTKADPDFFFGFAKDVWQSFAVCYTYINMKGE